MSHYYFWLHNQLHPDSPTYNIPAVFRIYGPLDISALQASIDTVISRHEVFGIAFSAQGEILPRHIQDNQDCRVEQIQLVGEPEQLQRRIREEITLPFDLSTGPLIRIRLLQVDPEHHILLIVMHHIITDLRSKELLGAQITVCYDTIVKKKNLPCLAPSFQYSNYVNRQQAWKSSPPAREMIEFWKKEIQDYSGSLALPLDYRRPPVAGSLGAAHFFAIVPEDCQSFQECCRHHSIAPFVALLTCYLILLARYSRQKNIVVGVPLTNRRHAEDKDTLGCFINILPLAIELHRDLTVLQAMKLVRWKLLQAHRNQEIAFRDIVSAAQLPREPSYNPLFQVGFTYEPPMELPLTGLKVVSEKWHNLGAQLDLFLNIFEMSPGIQGYFEYNQDLFAPATIARMSDHYRLLVRSWHNRTQEKIGRVEILTPEERTKLLSQWNQTAVNFGEAQCLSRLFENQAARSPDAVAVIAQETSLTYRELDARANQLAHYLQAQGIGPEKIVAVFMERSLEMVIALYAVIKAGGAYVPLEPDFPEQRLDFILNETDAPLVLTQQHLREKLPQFAGTALCLDSEWSAVADYPSASPVSATTPDNLAYVIYTSGSTGKPKGVMIEHKGVYNRLQWMQAMYPLGPQDKVLQKTPFSFDVSVWEFFWPLMTGASLVVPPPNAHKEPARLCRIIEQYAITTVHFVPSMLRIFLDAGERCTCPSLKRVFSSGEVMTWELRTAFLAKFFCDLHNLYGPTEATIDVTTWNCRQQTYPGKVPIGYPVANTRIYILDENLQPVPEGAAGELYIGGVQVARGYLQRAELNETMFIPDPFLPGGRGRLYKTGDLARYLPDGAIEYLGRADFQIKLFGNRIEPAEIEAALCSHPLIQDAVVTCSHDPGGKQQLVAYLLSKAASPDELKLRPYLTERLPYFMIPNHFVILQEFPLTGSGKINRKALPLPEQTGDTRPPDPAGRGLDYLLLVRSAWKQILGCDVIGDHQNFFDAGGNSLLATQVVFALGTQLGTDIPLVKIFQYPTISGLSEYLEGLYRPSLNAGGHECRRRIRKRHLTLTRKRRNK